MSIFSGLIEERLLPRCHIVATGRQEAGKEVSKCCDTLFQIGGFTEDHLGGFVTKYFKKRHDLAQLYLNMVECVLRQYIEKEGTIRNGRRTDRSLQTAIESLRVSSVEWFTQRQIGFE